MKKSLFIITCFCSILTISCASKKTPVNEENFESPIIDSQSEDTIQENEETNQTDSENQNETDEDLITIENSDSNSDDSNASNEPQMEIIEQEEILLDSEQKTENETSSSDYVLEELEEPEIITLEPEPEPKPENSDNQDEQTELNDFVLEVDVTDVELQDENQNETDSANDFSDNNNPQDDDIVLLIESDNSPIDITYDDIPEPMEEEISSDSEEQFQTEQAKIIPSRKVTLKRMEYLDISYPGRGWIYMGITDGSKDLSYFGRKLGTSDTNFTFQAKIEGTKILHFTKNDTLQNEYIEDYIEVEILSEKGSNKTHIKAPEFKMQSKKQQNEISKEENTEFSDETVENVQKNDKNPASPENNSSEITEPQTDFEEKTKTFTEKKSEDKESLISNSNDAAKLNLIEEKEDFDPKTLLKEAKLLYNEKEYSFALEKIEKILEKSDIGKDEALYLQGQCYEAKSEIQNIKKALNSYSLLVENFPASRYWDNANKRIIYLKRFYLEAR